LVVGGFSVLCVSVFRGSCCLLGVEKGDCIGVVVADDADADADAVLTEEGDEGLMIDGSFSGEFFGGVLDFGCFVEGFLIDILFRSLVFR
jgi:hypothetical protein